MGICESCLGHGRKRGAAETDETSRLLGGPYQSPYGTLGPDGVQSGVEDALQKKREALERLCISTSHKFVDVSNFSHLGHDTAAANGLTDLDRLVLGLFDPQGLSQLAGEGDDLDEEEEQLHTNPSDSAMRAKSGVTASARSPGFSISTSQQPNQKQSQSKLNVDAPPPEDESMLASSPTHKATAKDHDTEAGSDEEIWLRRLMRQNEKGDAVWDVLMLENLPLCVGSDLWD